MTPLDLESLRGHTEIIRITAEGSREFAEHCGSEMKQAMRDRGAQLDRAANDFDALIAELTARRAREEAVEAIAAADNTLHSAMDHWQERAIRAEAALRARDAEVDTLVAALRHARDELASFPHSLGYAITALPKIDAALLPFQRSDDKGDAT